MTLSDAAVKIFSTLVVALLGYVLKHLSKFQLFTTFRRLSNADRSRLFSLLHKSNDGFLDDYTMQSQMLAYGIRYTPQFMKNLFYYTHRKNIRADNKDLSAFLSLPGLFICKDDGEVILHKCARTINFFLFILSISMAIYVVIFLPEYISNLQIYLVQQHYFLLLLQVLLVLVCIPSLIMSLVIIYIILCRSIPAFRFVRGYRTAWKRRDLFEKGEQNLYCGNKIRE